MAKQFYYLVSSLPAVNPAEKPFYSAEQFLEVCSRWLDEKELSIVAAASINEPFSGELPDPASIAWRIFEKNLRNAIIHIRAKKLELEPRKFLREVEDINTAFAVKLADALKSSSPLETERKLIMLRWDMLEETAGALNFELGVLVCYHLKLQLAERMQEFNDKTGKERFTGICETTLKKV